MKFKKRPTKRLAEVIDSDLLTATERVIKGQLGGFYCLADEAAYFKTSSDKASMSLKEFEQLLRKTVDPNFFIVYNPKLTKEHQVEGHQIGLYVDRYKGFIPFIKVGKSASKTIPANSQGKVVQYKGRSYNRSGGTWMDEEAILYRGWVAAYEACKELIRDIKKHGVSPMRCISPKEFMMYKKTVEQINGDAILHEAMKDAAKAINAQIDKEAKKIEKDAIDFLKSTAKPEIKEVVE